MSSNYKKKFLDSVPDSKLREYKKCLYALGRPSKECQPIREEFKTYLKANKSAPKTKPKAKVAPKAKVVPKPKATKCADVKSMSSNPASEKAFKNECKSVTEANKKCKVFRKPQDKKLYCYKPSKKGLSKTTVKSLSQMA